MSDIIYFHNAIEIFNNQVLGSKHLYFLLSLDDRNICWMIKANTQINEDHIRLMELILPYGVKVKGFLHYGVDSSIDEDEILRSIRISFGGNRYLISEELYVIERLHGKENMFDNSSFRYIKYNPILGVIQTLDKPKPSIKFIDINSKIKEEFVYFQSSINIITLANINSYIQNELFHSDVGLYLPDYNILIYDNLNDEEWNELALNNQRKLEKLQSKVKSFDINIRNSNLI